MNITFKKIIFKCQYKKIQNNLSNLESFIYEVSVNKSTQHTKSLIQDKPEIYRSMISIKARIAKFEINSSLEANLI
ncbi:hypothetical protein [Rickettsia typhi]|uniref:Uncharacterized protein n=2 Tax=Rickettsia typhi TaxID=785 RepID=Q68WZ9_RICTY|nr:hypothetical protein [Rickettsia typhi]AAU03843.1 hypothetical protein RT0364 [Rickettsia typhi str. Wilmington]AFE54221.1 hypothetical protein RTTH1527_01780 [Rickettsia typhi str. TH1527]AFE55061.1 hypothetical protein RTB9991CWPP_01790 [Rickettsia typhi str. B9991CWPP]